jgi:hypothetical protein
VSARWPNLFIVGAHKAGTTSLWAYLGQHPEILAPRTKEPRYFSPDEPAGSIQREQHYLRLFARGKEAFRIDATPSYLGDPTAAGAIAGKSPDARILISLRDPVERAYSHYRHSCRLGRESRPFLTAVEAEIKGELDPRARGSYVARGLYAEQVARYLEVFGDRVHVLFFDDLVQQPRAAVVAILRFLQLDETGADRLDYTPRNIAAVPRNPLAQRAFASPSALQLARGLVPARFRGKLERRLLASLAVPPIDERARRLLTDVFAPDAERLRVMLGRPLPWESREPRAAVGSQRTSSNTGG